MLTCPSCGEENPERAKFCLNCASPLATPKAQLEERKVVTVLFCDLVGFTEASDRADPEDVRARLRPYHAMLRREIERFGGTVEKFIGDAVMAVFGAPVAHEDDAERAVRAAYRITGAIEELNEEDRTLELQVRVGVNTGEAVVALAARPEAGEGFVTGDVVNTASRLQSVAPTGEILVGAQTHQLTLDAIDYERLDPVSVKGKVEPLPVWRVKGARSRLGTDIEDRPGTPFLGRDDELEVLKRTFARAVREPSVQLVTVTGEPGVGKSRLIRELFAHVDDLPALVYWRQGRCLPYGEAITFWALGDVVKAHAGILESDLPAVAREKLRAAVESAVEDEIDREWICSRLGPLAGVGGAEGSTEREESFTAWRRFFEGIAATAPLVMVIEDLHWADQAMLEFVEHLADWSSGVPILVACTARPELYERSPSWGGGRRNATTISLPPLTDSETARLVQALLSRSVLPAEVQSLLLTRAGGNPLYAEEFVRMLTDRGLIDDIGRAASGQALEALFPGSIQALIAARLDTLPPDRKALLQDAAVIGKVFWSGAVAALADREDRDVQEEMHDLARKELIRPARVSSMKQEAEYSFWHILVRDVAYSQIPRGVRAAKHAAVARWIEATSGERVADVADVLVHHYSTAMELAQASGSGDAAELAGSALKYLLLAGDRARSLDASSAAEHYERALALAPPGSVSRPTVLARAAGVAKDLGNLDQARAQYEQALEVLESLGDRRQIGHLLSRLAVVRWYQGDILEANRMSRRAIDLLEGVGAPEELSHACTRAASLAIADGRASEGAEWAQRALEIEEAGPAERVQAMVYRGMARCQLGDPSGLEDERVAISDAIDMGLSSFAATNLLNRSTDLLDWEGPASSLRSFREALDFADRRGLVDPRMASRSSMLDPLFMIGEWDELLAVAEEVISWTEIHGELAIRDRCELGRLGVLALRGPTEEAGSLATRLAGSTSDWGVKIMSNTRAVQILHRMGEVGGMAEALGQLSVLAEDVGATWLGEYLPEMVRAALTGGDVSSAERLSALVQPRVPRYRFGLSTAGAELDQYRGRFPEALLAYQQSASDWSTYGNVVEEGYALLGAGRCLLGLGRLEEARRRLLSARVIFARLGASLALFDVDQTLHQTIALSS